MLGLRHLHKRKRVLEREPKTVHAVVAVSWLTILIYIAAILGPLALLPQVAALYTTHQASGLALPTWVMLGILNMVWIFYGYKHKEMPIVLTNIAAMLLNFAVVAGIVLFS